MDTEIYKLLIQYGGGIAVIVAIIFLLKELTQLLKLKTNTNNNHSDSLDNRVKTLEKIASNDMHELRADINVLQQEMANIRERVRAIETVLKNKKIMK